MGVEARLTALLRPASEQPRPVHPGLLEAIFLSTFVLISQNRADAKRQVIADEQWRLVQEEDTQNKELLDLSNQILALTREVRALTDSLADKTELTALRDEVHALTASLEQRRA